MTGLPDGGAGRLTSNAGGPAGRFRRHDCRRCGHNCPLHSAYPGVVVDQGKHTIEMRYLPASVFAGLALTLVGVGGAVGLTILAHRRKGRAGALARSGPPGPQQPNQGVRRGPGGPPHEGANT